MRKLALFRLTALEKIEAEDDFSDLWILSSLASLSVRIDRLTGRLQSGLAKRRLGDREDK